MKSITLFSWGYWGWGSATAKLREAVDLVEAGRGFGPPQFVDIRISRSVRAEGFRDSAFEKIIGGDRYTWMRKLGNRRIETRTGPRIQIADPAAVSDLYELALSADSQGSRVIFFCSCERPVSEHGESCHRVEVAKLIRSYSPKQGTSIRTIEWPGGEPTEFNLEVSANVLHEVKSGRASLMLPGPVRLDRFGSLAWGTRICLVGGDETLTAVVGPAKFSSNGWYLPVLNIFAGPEKDRRTPTVWAARFRKLHGYEPKDAAGRKRRPIRPVVSGNKERQLSESCVYTIAHPETLDLMIDGGGKDSIKEGKRWASGSNLLKESRSDKMDLPVVFADSTDCSKIMFSAILTRINLTRTGTKYSFERLRRLPRKHSQQEMVLLSTGKRIARGFIRPYALCKTPAFLKKPRERRK